MYSYDLALPGELNLRIRLDHPALAHDQARLLAAAYLPGVRFRPHPFSGRPDLTITYRQSDSKELQFRGRNLTVHDRWNDGSLLDLLNLAYGAMRLQWLRHALYPVHSACVGNGKSYTLVVGPSGAGKTSIALRLAGANKAQLFSGNKTLVSIDAAGDLQGVGGTRTITTRAEDARRNLPDAEALGYCGRSAFELREHMYSGHEAVAIQLIAFVRLNDGAAQCERLSPLSALHRLFPVFLDKGYEDTVVCAGHAVFPGDPPRGCRTKLLAALRLACARVPVMSIAGSMDHVINMLEANR
jgi:hypothetical protein